MAIQYQPIPILFTAGLDTKSNDQASKPPAMDVLRNVEFDKINGYQKRKPFNLLPNAIQGGGTLANCRQIFEYRGELCVFSNDTLYSYAQQTQTWVAKGTHLAAKVTDRERFVTPMDIQESDRAEINNTVVYVFSDVTSNQIFIAAYDKLSGAVLLSPTWLVPFTGSRPKIIALANTFLIFAQLGSGTAATLTVWSLTPANVPTVALSAPVNIATVTTDQFYDVCKHQTADSAIVACQLDPTTSYQVTLVSNALALTSVTKARTCVSNIAISCVPDGSGVQICRTSTSTAVVGDLLALPALGDSHVNEAIGTSDSALLQLGAAHQSVTHSGVYRCEVFWNGTFHNVFQAWVDTAGTIGPTVDMVGWVTVASRPFDFNGNVFVWLVFSEASTVQFGLLGTGAAAQNAYYLYRDDGFLCGKACYNNAGGVQAPGYLPTVQQVGGVYTFCGQDRRIIPITDDITYANRAPHDVSVQFDTNEARRTARFGDTKYIAAGEILQYDSVRIAEVGFHIYPWNMVVTTAGGGGAMANGTYGYKICDAWTNGVGETEESTTATVGSVVISAGPTGTVLPVPPTCFVTHKPLVDIEVYRTQANPIASSPFLLVSSTDPSAITNPNRYLTNFPSFALPIGAFNDALNDSSITGHKADPENGSVLERLAPPAATLILATKDRLFLGGVAGQPDSVWYSRLRGDGEVASFNDGLTIEVPVGGGDITGMALLNETLIVFRQHACFAFAGTGFDNTGGGQNFSGTRISSDIGAVNMEGIAKIDNAILFKSSKGWFQVTQNLQVIYVGATVADFDADVPLSTVVMETQHQVRCLTSGRMLVWDTVVNNWSEWTIADGLGSCVWQGQHVYLTATGPKIQALDFTGVDYGIKIAMAFLKPADLQGSSRVRSWTLQGEYRGDHRVQLDTARDYIQDGAGNWAYLPDPQNVYVPSSPVVGSIEQVRHGPSVVKYQAIKIQVTELLGLGGVWTEGLRLTGVTFDAGSDGKAWPFLPASQKA